MLKEHFLKEINIKAAVKAGSKGDDVKKIQEWINLQRSIDSTWKHIVAVDGEFGPQTEEVIKIYQGLRGLTVDGIVGSKTYHELVKPMIKAFTKIERPTLRERIVAYAQQHLDSNPKELYNSNHGPWVRAYMDGHEGKDWAWCMGFVQTVLDQAFSGSGQNFTLIMPHTYSCDVVGFHGRTNGKLINHETYKGAPDSFIKAGDIFLVRRTSKDWTHTGIVIGVSGNMLHTIEGNTNDEGSREGFEVCKRLRNVDKNVLDVFVTAQ